MRSCLSSVTVASSAQIGERQLLAEISIGVLSGFSLVGQNRDTEKCRLFGDQPRQIRVRALVPEGEITGVYLHFHGGGWVLGECDEQDLRLSALAAADGLAVVSEDDDSLPAGATVEVLRIR